MQDFCAKDKQVNIVLTAARENENKFINQPRN